MAINILLGYGGAIGIPLASELLACGERVRTVSRTGAGPEGADAKRADLLDPAQVAAVVDEGATVYLLAGLKYDLRTWRDQWPRIMRNVVSACASMGARLVFLDNVYMYGAVDGPMTEDTPIRPTSRKGEVRAAIAGYLQEEMAAGRITAAIARAADFYGPHADKSSVPYILVLNRLAAGKSAQVFCSADTRHSYTYTLDCAKALCLLAAAPDAFGQVWHLPTACPLLSGREFVDLAARALGVAPRLSVIPAWTLKLAGLFSPMMRELAEMLYQNDRDYVFDSSKFERRFGFWERVYGRRASDELSWFQQSPVTSLRLLADSGLSDWT
jgi:nucleoside-diphosphate-sugar epimerase